MAEKDKLPMPATSPISKIRVIEYMRKLGKLPVSMKRKVLDFLETIDRIDDAEIEQIKNIIELEMGPEKAKPIVEEFTERFWKDGGDYASRQLKKLGITLEIPHEITLAIVDREILEQIKGLQLDLVKGLSEEIKKKIAYELREGWMLGESIPKLKNRIINVAEMGKRRAEMIARTESTRVFNRAAFERYSAVNIKKWRWLAAMDERTCPVCMSKHGKTFSGASQLPPHGSHVNCRCTIIPNILKT
ncbi:phage putative head morphogenesis protein, SPP1 gp7 family [Archaeoglobus sulfaticallidus PM70-1]|uniref:Phage putative head morphogenesis protein, SPP1 gp7 family n=1 Tax=Archaeoglobus sulfaticallidus PM70-1 TaxID=387631 RepID=N0BER8_9EURY|nr:phage minor head protein [Archaeoglobus sulfaticallidus]AGK61493.1 phage putative head morphogenesis protein, SPP1 gp7 family [Archaeoglobus sulfaticallidus PM70-1]